FGGGAVRRFGLTNHRHRSAAVRKAVSRFVVDGRTRRFSSQLGSVAASDKHSTALDVVKDGLIVEPALGISAEKILDGSRGFFRKQLERNITLGRVQDDDWFDRWRAIFLADCGRW